MTSSNSLTPLLEPLAALQRLIDRFREKGIVIGDIAASLLGRPRLTADLDAMLLVSIDDLPDLIEAAKEEGLSTRIHDAEVFARRNRILLLRHQKICSISRRSSKAILTWIGSGSSAG